MPPGLWAFSQALLVELADAPLGEGIKLLKSPTHLTDVEEIRWEPYENFRRKQSRHYQANRCPTEMFAQTGQ